MALATIKFLFIGICLIFLTTFGSGLRIVSDPEPYRGRTEALTISCIMDEPTTWAKSIVGIRIMKQNEDTIAVVDLKQDLRMGSGSRENMKAEGFVDRDGQRSYLIVTINNPDSHDAGLYKCQVLYMDQQFKIAQENVDVNVTFQEPVPATTATSTTTPTTTITSTTTAYLTTTTGCPDEGWSFYKEDNTCLKIFGDDDASTRLNWSKARQFCQKYGGDLVQIRDKDKNNFVYNKLGGARKYSPWIGIKNHATRGFDFKFVDGSDTGTYHPWGSGDPNGDKEGGAKCVGMYGAKHLHGKWYDANCSTPRPYVCSIGQAA